MFQFRFYTKLLAAFLNRFKLIIFLGFLAGIILFLALRFISPVFFSGTTTKVGVVGRFTTSEIPSYILGFVSSGLTSVDEKGVPVPDIAESWEAKDSGKEWIFHLKKDIKWHDGENLTSKSLVYEFTDVDIERPDESTIVFKLKNPFAPFPTVVSKPTFKKGFIGVGQWKVTHVSLLGDYVSELIITNKNQKKIYRFYPTEEMAKTAFKLGKVTSIISLYDPKPLDAWITTKVNQKSPINQVVTLFLNTQSKNLSDKSIRQALAYSIKKDNLNGERVISPIPSYSWAYNPQVKPYDYDLEKAKQTINSLSKEQKTNLQINLFTSQALLSTAEKISLEWKEIGVKTNIKVSSGVPEEYDVYLALFELPVDPDQYLVWHSTQTDTNISKYKSPRVDKLLEDGRVELIFEKRKEIYLDFQRFLLEDSPAIFLTRPTFYDIVKK